MVAGGFLGLGLMTGTPTIFGRRKDWREFAHVHVDDGHADQRVQLAEVGLRAPGLRQQRLQRVHCARKAAIALQRQVLCRKQACRLYCWSASRLACNTGCCANMHYQKATYGTAYD